MAASGKVFFQQGSLGLTDSADQNRAMFCKTGNSGCQCLIAFALGKNHFAKTGAQAPLGVQRKTVQGIANCLRTKLCKGCFRQQAACGNFRKNVQNVWIPARCPFLSWKMME